MKYLLILLFFYTYSFCQTTKIIFHNPDTVLFSVKSYYNKKIIKESNNSLDSIKVESSMYMKELAVYLNKIYWSERINLFRCDTSVILIHIKKDSVIIPSSIYNNDMNNLLTTINRLYTRKNYNVYGAEYLDSVYNSLCYNFSIKNPNSEMTLGIIYANFINRGFDTKTLIQIIKNIDPKIIKNYKLENKISVMQKPIQFYQLNNKFNLSTILKENKFKAKNIGKKLLVFIDDECPHTEYWIQDTNHFDKIFNQCYLIHLTNEFGVTNIKNNQFKHLWAKDGYFHKDILRFKSLGVPLVVVLNEKNKIEFLKGKNFQEKYLDKK